MSDLIERDKVIEYCLKLIDVERKQGSDVMNYGQERINQTDAIIAFVENLPSADRPKGKWLLSDLQSQVDNDNGNYAYVCTNCNHTDIHAKTQKVPYCWWCGARMKGADDE